MPHRLPRTADLLPALLPALLVLACSGGSSDDDDDELDAPGTEDISGDWAGACVLQADGYTVDVNLAMVLDQGDTGGGRFTGTATSDFSGEEWEGTVLGTRTSLAAEATVSLSTEDGYEIAVILDGDLEGASWSGACTQAAVSGTFTLTQAR